jgi:predicted amidohydrolase
MGRQKSDHDLICFFRLHTTRTVDQEAVLRHRGSNPFEQFALERRGSTKVSRPAAPANLRAAAEEPDGKTARAIGDKARQHGAYVTAPIHRRIGDAVANSLVLLDRGGKPLGVYDKVHPVMMRDGSLEYGIAPGREFPVFELDFGRVGMQICWDVGFEDGWRALGNQDVELVLFATNPAVPIALRGYAWRHGYYIAASAVHPPSVVVDPVGRVVASTSADREVIVTRVNLDYRVLHSNCMWDWSLAEHKEYEGRIRIEWDKEAHEYLVSSVDSELPVSSFLAREGLLTGRQRNGRNTELQLQARGGAPVVPLPVATEAGVDDRRDLVGRNPAEAIREVRP